MLKQTEHADAPAPSAAQVRVTPEELAAAISHLDAGRAGQDGKIAIGRAVEELSLDAAPEDILRAVEATRQQTARRRRNRRGGVVALFAGLAAVGGLGVWGFERLPRPAPAIPVVPQTLSALGEGQSAYVDTRGLKQIIDRIYPTQIQTYPNSKGIRWGIIKHGGRIYVQAYTLETTEKGINGKTFDLRNAEEADLNGRYKGNFITSGKYSSKMHPDVKVTLPLEERLQYRDSQQLEDQAVLMNVSVRSDDHLWDNFEHNH